VLSLAPQKKFHRPEELVSKLSEKTSSHAGLIDRFATRLVMVPAVLVITTEYPAALAGWTLFST
jgi:hypothetical protein